jgi:hypothetical protein
MEAKTVGTRKIKRLRDYIARIKAVAKTMHVKVQFRDIESQSGEWRPEERKIVIHYKQSDTALLSALLHEMGHVMDDVVNCTRTKYVNRLDRYYNNLNEGNITRGALKQIIACEKRAWDYGKTMASSLMIPTGKWYKVERRKALKTYKDAGKSAK